ncbi:MAG TPA: hypothetical protein VIK06_07465 [Candidatus Limnocylindrales bacterium]
MRETAVVGDALRVGPPTEAVDREAPLPDGIGERAWLLGLELPQAVATSRTATQTAAIAVTRWLLIMSDTSPPLRIPS